LPGQLNFYLIQFNVYRAQSATLKQQPLNKIEVFWSWIFICCGIWNRPVLCKSPEIL